MQQDLSHTATARLICLSLLTAGMCLVAIFPMPYGYYTFLRWVVSIMGVALAIALPRAGYWGVAIFAGAVAILFNPIVKVPASRDAWKWLDAGGGLLFVFFALVLMVHFIRVSPPSREACNSKGTPEGGSLEEKLDRVAENAASRIRDRHRPPEVSEVFRVLAEIAPRFDTVAFQLVSTHLREVVLVDTAAFTAMVRNGTPVGRWVWGAVSNTAADLVESGEYHIHRGVLDPMGPGDGLVRIFDTAADELCMAGLLSDEFATRQKAALRKNIADVG